MVNLTNTSASDDDSSASDDDSSASVNDSSASDGESDSYLQPDDSQSESPETFQVDEEDLQIMTPPNTPDLRGPADSGVEECDDESEEEWENIDPTLRPPKQRHDVSVH